MDDSRPDQPRWLCAQIGAREHYAVPRALLQADRRISLYTDFWAGALVRQCGFKGIRSMVARHHPDLDKRAEIHSWNIRCLLWERRRRSISVRQTAYHGFIATGQAFAECVREQLSKCPDLGANTIYFGYDTGALETLAWCRERGIKCVVGQMDPSRVEISLVQAEEKLWPGWSLHPLKVPEEYFERREREWMLADRVVVNSEFSRKAMEQQGVPAEKLAVIPLCFESGNAVQESKVQAGKSAGPLRVLFLGQVILRKGIQYLLAAARELGRENIHFDIVGPPGISRKAVDSAPANVTFHGRTSRDQVKSWYEKSHLFALPTLSDGFAITQLEAMAHGLPVVATPNCGDVVTDGEDGCLVPVRDAGALARAFRQYLDQPELLAAQSRAALEKARQFSLKRLGENLVGLEAELLGNESACDFQPEIRAKP